MRGIWWDSVVCLLMATRCFITAHLCCLSKPRSAPRHHRMLSPIRVPASLPVTDKWQTEDKKHRVETPRMSKLSRGKLTKYEDQAVMEEKMGSRKPIPESTHLAARSFVFWELFLFQPKTLRCESPTETQPVNVKNLLLASPRTSPGISRHELHFYNEAVASCSYPLENVHFFA